MRKSRLWTAFSAVVGLATLVVLASCQGPIGPAGKDGAGAPGAPGAAGPAGGVDNEGPTTLEAIPTQYLVIGGKAAPAATANYGSVVIDLNSYFTDAKTPSLSYKAVSSPKGIVSLSASATTDLVADGKLTVTAAGVGTVATAKSATASVTVSAFDGTNEAETATFDVVVVKKNAPPTAIGVDPIDGLVGANKLYKAAGTITLEFKATIVPGTSGRATDPEPLKLRALVGGGTAADAVVLVTTPVISGVNTYSVDITAVKPLDPPKDVAVKIFAMDSFGAETEVTSFDVMVNTPPSVLYELPDVELYREGATVLADSDARGWTIASNFQQVFYELDDYFKGLELDSVDGAATPVTTIGDTMCEFSTSPKQPTGRVEIRAAPAESIIVPAVKPIAIDPVKTTTLATVNNGTDMGLETALIDDENRTDATGGMTARVEVDSDAMQDEIDFSSAVLPNIPYAAPVTAIGVGVFTLTIMCEDPDGTAMSEATIRVSAGTNA